MNKDRKDNSSKSAKSWTRPRHALVTRIAKAILAPYCRLRYGITVDRLEGSESGQYLILMNHQTPFDQFFCGMAFDCPVYYLATEDIFSNGAVSSLIRYLVAPIPIKKQTMDLKAIISCIRVAGEGGTIAIFPEGNRTYSGRTEYINPSIVSLVRKLGLPIALMRIEGGYGTQPRWSDTVRRGRMHAYVSRVISREEYSNISDEELFGAISDELYVNEAAADGKFCGNRLAEYLERAIYYCPECGLSELESHRNIITCKKCGRQVRYTEEKELYGVGFELPYRFVADWYDAQAEYMNSLDVRKYVAEPMFRDVAGLYEVIPCKCKKRIAKGAQISLFGNRVTISQAGADPICLDFDRTSTVTVLGKNKLNIYSDGKIYQIKGSKRFNALKYVHVFYRYNNLKRGNENGKFLGL